MISSWPQLDADESGAPEAERRTATPGVLTVATPSCRYRRKGIGLWDDALPEGGLTGTPAGRRSGDGGSTACYSVLMSVQPEISQRDLRLRSREIMDSVERGQAFTVTRDGHQIGELLPLRRRRTFIPRSEFLTSAGTSEVDPERFRRDLDAVIDDDIHDAYAD